jgi:hypothetical protein
MIGMIDPAGKGVVLDGSASPFKSRKQTCSDVSRNLELDRTSGFLLDDHGAGSDFLACDEGVPILILTRSQPLGLLSIARSNSAGLACAPLYRGRNELPNLALLQGLLYADLPAGVPYRATQCSRIILCDTHLSSPSAKVGRLENVCER